MDIAGTLMPKPEYPQHAKDIWGTYLYETDSEGNEIEIWFLPRLWRRRWFIALDQGDYDGQYDTSDGKWATKPESFVDANNNGIYDQGESFTDSDGNGYYTQGDWHPNLDIVYDTDGDGINDYPDFEVVNNKLELRVDYDPSQDLNFSFQTAMHIQKHNR